MRRVRNKGRERERTCANNTVGDSGCKGADRFFSASQLRDVKFLCWFK